MGGKKEIQVELWEWDMQNGEYVYREKFEVGNEEEAYKILEETIREAEKDGWVCDPHPEGFFICTKIDDEGYVLERQVGVDILG